MGQYNKTGEEILHAMPFLYGSYGYNSFKFCQLKVYLGMTTVKNFMNFFIVIEGTSIF